MMKTLVAMILSGCALTLQAESIRVNVFKNNQRQYLDIKVGQTLGQICLQWCDISKTSVAACQQDIVARNPQAFVNANPDYLLAGARLWLPGAYQSISSQDSRHYQIQRFSWGSIKTPR
ncbi:MAG: hypothetical protein OEY36_01570 [Gammaproteobacteria bacterium]|nr:hypothetical protein [Gammaproteobacteria bacterium]